MVVLCVHGLSSGNTALGQVDDLAVSLVSAFLRFDHGKNGGDGEYRHAYAGELEDGGTPGAGLGQGLGLGDFALASFLSFAFLSVGFLLGLVEESHGTVEAGVVAVGPGFVRTVFLAPR